MRVKETQIRRIGNSAGVTIPKEMLDQLDLATGDTVFMQQNLDGILISPFDPAVAKALAIYRKGAKQYRNAMRALSEQ